MRVSNALPRPGGRLVAGAGLLLALGACAPSATTATQGPVVSASSGSSSSVTSGAKASTSTTARPPETTTTRGPSSTSSTTSRPATTSTTPTSTAPASSTSTPAAATVVLRADGLGVATFGQPEAVAEAALSAALGPPTSDEGWVDGGMDGRPNRLVTWGGLWVKFYENDTGRYFASWRLSGFAAQVLPGDASTPALATPDGLRLGLTYGELAPRLADATLIDGEGASGYRLALAEGPVYVWFDPPIGDSHQPPAPTATVVVLDAGDPGAGHNP